MQCVLKTPAVQAKFFSCVFCTDSERDHGCTGRPIFPPYALNRHCQNFSVERKDLSFLSLLLPSQYLASVQSCYPDPSHSQCWCPLPSKLEMSALAEKPELTIILMGAEYHQSFQSSPALTGGFSTHKFSFDLWRNSKKKPNAVCFTDTTSLSTSTAFQLERDSCGKMNPFPSAYVNGRCFISGWLKQQVLSKEK